jgi:hypothetical protein
MGVQLDCHVNSKGELDHGANGVPGPRDLFGMGQEPAVNGQKTSSSCNVLHRLERSDKIKVHQRLLRKEGPP